MAADKFTTSEEEEEEDEEYQEQEAANSDPYLKFVFERSNTPEFTNLKTYEDYFNYSLKSLLDDKTELRKFNETPPETKCNIASANYRRISFEEFKLSESPNLDTIIQHCTKSVAWAKPSSKALISAYINRSSALYKSHLFEDCLSDIERIEGTKLPDSQKIKILIRKAKCCKILNHDEKIVSELNQEIHNMCEKLSPKNPSKQLAIKYLKNPDSFTNKKPFKKLIFEENEGLIVNENSNIIGASDGIKISYSDDYGRHIIATRDIKPGEGILFHKPYARYLIRDAYYQFCSYCLKQTWSAVACKYCVFAVFCSDNCRELAWQEYHDIECQIISLTNIRKMDTMPMLGLKITIKAIKEAGGIEELEKKIHQYDKITDPLEKGLTNGKFDPSKYASVYSLATNIENYRPDTKFHYSNCAVMLAYLLGSRTDFLNCKISNDPESIYDIKNLSFIGKLLLHNVLIVKSNSYSLGDYQGQFDFDERATALSPTLSLFNHGCFSKIEKFEFNDKLSVQTICLIEKNEQIYLNYGCKFESSPKCQREQFIEMRFKFKCKCIACLNDWPSDLSVLPVVWLPDEIACRLFGAYMLYHRALKADNENGNFYFDENIDRQVIKREIINAVEIIYPHVQHPSQDLITFMEMLSSILGSRSTRWQTLD